LESRWETFPSSTDSFKNPSCPENPLVLDGGMKKLLAAMFAAGKEAEDGV
jgi:hypothetical protein